VKDLAIAVIGAGSSGLVTLRELTRHLPHARIACFEKGNSVIGCWGRPYQGFVSTSTKYTTQFASFVRYDPVAGHGYEEFFRDGEYGDYLEAFAEHYDLRRFIRFHCDVRRIRRGREGWLVEFDEAGNRKEEAFSHVIVCTGVAERPRTIDSCIETLQSIGDVSGVKGKTVVVIGGGESAADVANRLAEPKLGNRVHLSLRHGIRVSPRYHPIRGVPSDFLRNRLLLSIDRDLRNAIGQRFVEARIRYIEVFHRLFPGKRSADERAARISERRREWDLRLTKAAKDQLFNVFHNKSDGFLDAVGEGRIEIIGPPLDEHFVRYQAFGMPGSEVEVQPDLIVPMLGYESRLRDLFGGEVEVPDFYLGSIHARYEDLFLVGFARPIIGNIPSISEQQAKLIARMIAGKVARPSDIADRHQRDRARLQEVFPTINREVLYPVEMFPYCDALAGLMGTYPSLRKVKSFRRWLKIKLSPATTLHYLDEDHDPARVDNGRIYTPALLSGLLALIWFGDRAHRFIRKSARAILRGKRG